MSVPVTIITITTIIPIIIIITGIIITIIITTTIIIIVTIIIIIIIIDIGRGDEISIMQEDTKTTTEEMKMEETNPGVGA